MQPLSREAVRAVIEGRGAADRIPLAYDHWTYSNIMGGDETRFRQWMAQFPHDIQYFEIPMPDLLHAPADDPQYRWTGVDKEEDSAAGLDNRPLVDDWESEEAAIFFDTFPSAEYPGLVPEFHGDGQRYVLARWWYCLFERLWSIRGMENALMDFFLHPAYIHRLFEKLTAFYCRMMERVCAAHPVDGFFVSDDLGMQHAAFFPVEIFQEFFAPYYRRIIAKAHALGCHFWLHSCGNIEAFLPDFIDMGLDVIHPIQKNTMDQREIAERFGGQICIWAGFDVQQTIPFGTVEDVRREVRRMIDTFWRPDGRFMLTMGNGSTPDWKIPCLEALYEESIAYKSHRQNARWS